MKFTEIDVLGVYVAPISILMIVAWLVTLVLRRIAAKLNLLQHVWHPALFVFDLYIIVLSSMVLFFAY